MIHTTISLKELVCKATKHLDLLGYAEGTKNRYISSWKAFFNYAENRGNLYFSKELGHKFLENCYGIKADMKLTTHQVFKVRSIAVLGEILEYDSFLICHQKPAKQEPIQFSALLGKYNNKNIELHLSKRTLASKKATIICFLIFLDKQGINDIATLTSHEVLSYIHTLDEYRQSSKSGILFALRDFLYFLYSEGHIKDPLNNLFPIIFSNKHERLPSFYSTDEINMCLCHVDRDTIIGRRDYLVLILAVQLGMRAGDIRQLKLENIKWSRNTVELIQQKTKKPLKLPLTEELKYALADYMKNSRPKVDDSYIFLRHRAPFQPFAQANVFYHIINKYMTLAGIKINNRKHGLHAMRHSAASNLLENGTPYPVITGILGHENTSTTKLYLRIDIGQLRNVALEVPSEK